MPTTKNNITQTATQANQNTPAAEVPDWVTFTPEVEEVKYNLEMWQDCTATQDQQLTREEYIALKAHLAKLRGYAVPRATEDTGEPEQATEPPATKPTEKRFQHTLPLPPAEDFSNLEVLEAAHLALSRENGCNTPAEEFIETILSTYGVCGTLLPVHIEQDFKIFRDNFEAMADDVRLFIAHNPDFAKSE